ncbi:MAG TPA: hypothetical protein VLQ80_04940 [Candidatus Saccharimonadia bacterium]|nr:hypothetical protein [Candidatus Saccharimonadia bacterium]
MKRLAGGMDRGLEVSREALQHVGLYAQALPTVEDTLRPSTTATGEEREARFSALQQVWQSHTDPGSQHGATMMRSFAPGLLVGGEAAEFPADNWDLERCFQGPKGHERRMHGHRHAGVRIVQQGPTLMLALDAPGPHEGPLTVGALAPYGHARVPESQQQAVERGKIMRQARSRKKRSVWLADLEKRYCNAL